MPLTNTLAVASARGFGFGTEDAFGEQVFTAPGTYTFFVPAGVTSVSMVTIGGAGGGSRPARYTSISDPNSIVAYSPIPGSLTANFYSGGGGALAYKNSVSVTPGQALTVFVGVAGDGANSGDSNGTGSYVETAGGTKLVHAGGGNAGSSGAGGTVLVGDGGGAGGAGGLWSYAGGSGVPNEKVFASGGGGGAGGYSSAGGAGGNVGIDGSAGSGGGAGGAGGGRFGQYLTSSGNTENTRGYAGGAGGGTGLFGAGSSGAGGLKTATPFNFNSSATGGGGGSGGTDGDVSDGSSAGNNQQDGDFGVYGGGGAGAGSGISYIISTGVYQCIVSFAGSGQDGAVRIIWSTNPTVTRSFPSTNVGRL